MEFSLSKASEALWMALLTVIIIGIWFMTISVASEVVVDVTELTIVYSIETFILLILSLVELVTGRPFLIVKF